MRVKSLNLMNLTMLSGKERCKYIIAIDPNIWEVMSTGYRIEDPVIPSINDKRNIQNNAKAATAIFMGLQEHDFNRVSTMDTA